MSDDELSREEPSHGRTEGIYSPPHEPIDMYSPTNSTILEELPPSDGSGQVQTSPVNHPVLGPDEFYDNMALRLQVVARAYLARRRCLSLHAGLHRAYRVSVTLRDIPKLIDPSHGAGPLMSPRQRKREQSFGAWATALLRPTATYFAAHPHDAFASALSHDAAAAAAAAASKSDSEIERAVVVPHSEAFFSEEGWAQAALAERFTVRGRLANSSLSCTMMSRASYSTDHVPFGQSTVDFADVLPFPALDSGNLTVPLGKFVHVAVTDRTGAAVQSSPYAPTGGRLAALRRPSVGGVSSGSDNDSNSDSEGLRHVMGGRQLLMTLERSPLHRSRSGWLLFRERSPVGGGGGGGGWGGGGPRGVRRRL